MKLLNGGNYKTSKGESFGWKTYGLHLSPFNISGNNVCPNASTGCAAACLNTAGRGIMRNVQEARIRKTQFFFDDREGFLRQLFKEIKSSIKSATRKQLNSCFRLNLTSDIAWERYIIPAFKDHQFYDYTKSKTRMRRFLRGKLPENYHLTFSRSEDTKDAEVKEFCNAGGNVAVVFRGHLPSEWKGIKVIDGDVSDLRFQDEQGVIVGLVAKGLGKKDETGFVVEPK
jgi:hypothetical protein|tara:strand:- start:828 stop:1511 length:684 start_codon:yes stop_codon:yes gene_type:complete